MLRLAHVLVLLLIARMWYIRRSPTPALNFSYAKTILPGGYAKSTTIINSLHHVWMEVYCLENPFTGALRPECIRLLKIGLDNQGGLYVKYKRFRLASAPSYHALSYTWGPSRGVVEDIDPVIHPEEGDDDLPMPKNLFRALRHLQALDEDEWYWIDYLCINQINLAERSKQVSNMHNIYQQASTVDIWLGPAAHEELVAVRRVLRGLAKRGRKECRIRSSAPQHPWVRRFILLLPTREELRVLNPFFSRRWFHRIWTLQEFSLAKRARFHYGDGFIDDTTLGEAVSFLVSFYQPAELQYGYNDSAGAAVHQRYVMRELFFNVQQLAEFLPHFAANHGIPTYETVLAMTYWQSAAALAGDPRD